MPETSPSSVELRTVPRNSDVPPHPGAATSAISPGASIAQSVSQRGMSATYAIHGTRATDRRAGGLTAGRRAWSLVQPSSEAPHEAPTGDDDHTRARRPARGGPRPAALGCQAGPA